MDLTNPDDLRRLLARLEAWTLPGEAARLAELAVAGEPTTVDDWRVDVWGPLGVDGWPAHTTLRELLLWSQLAARPAVAAATTVISWHLATADEGLPGFVPIQAARIAQAALLREADKDGLARDALAERDTPRLLAEAWMRHARAFLEWDDLATVRAPVRSFLGDGTAVGPWWSLVRGAVQQHILRQAFRDQLPADLPTLAPWLDERDRDLPASTVGGVPWLSARLADYLRAKLGTDGAERAAAWLTREREREAERTAVELPIILPPRPALAGWLAAVDVPDLGPGWGVSPAALALARAVWRAEVRREVADRRDRETRTMAPAMPWPFAQARVALATPVTVDGGIVLSGTEPTGLAAAPGVDLATWKAPARPARTTAAPGVDLATWQAVASSLRTLSARRAVAWMASVAWKANAAGARGAEGEGWEAVRQHDGSVSVTVHGGASRLAAMLGGGKDAGTDMYRALLALTAVRLSAETNPTAGLTGALVAQVKRFDGAPGRPAWMACTLSPWWSPGAVQGLVTDKDRVIVPVLPPPPLSALAPRLHSHGAAMEERALIALATNARDVVKYGGGVIRWRELAPELRPADVDRLVEDWQTLGRWEPVGVDRWMLGTADSDLAAAGALIRQSGGIRETAAKGGRTTAEKKRKGLKHG